MIECQVCFLTYKQFKYLPFLGLFENFPLFFSLFFFSLFCFFSFCFADLPLLHFLSNAEAALAFSAWRTFNLFASSSSSSEACKCYLIWFYINIAQIIYITFARRRGMFHIDFMSFCETNKIVKKYNQIP